MRDMRFDIQTCKRHVTEMTQRDTFNEWIRRHFTGRVNRNEDIDKNLERR